MVLCILSDIQLEALICEGTPDFDFDEPNHAEELAVTALRLRSVTDRVLSSIAEGAAELASLPAAAGAYALLLQHVAGGIEAAA